jgi:hypothetical protein
VARAAQVHRHARLQLSAMRSLYSEDTFLKRWLGTSRPHLHGEAVDFEDAQRRPHDGAAAVLRKEASQAQDQIRPAS